MRKYKPVICFTLLCIGIMGVLGILGFFAVKGAYGKERATVENLAGVVVGKFPETEESFVIALNDLEKSNREEGGKILAPYGYHRKTDIFENPDYKAFVVSYFSLLAGFLAAAFAWGYYYFAALEKRQRKQEEQILALLERCLSGEYEFIESEEQLSRLNHPLFADMVRKLGKNLQLKTERLNEERDNTKELVTDISHQLKTPLSALETCFFMYVEADCEAEKKEFFERCAMQIDKLKALIASLVNISRLENNMISLYQEPVFLTEIMTAALNTVYQKAVSKNIEIVMEDFDDMNLCLDKRWTAEAVANILDNGIKYSPAGSSIVIRIQKRHSFVRIEIEDEGIGISKEEQNKIFQRFYRGGSNLVKNTEGSGVGLYLSRKILEEQGGTVSVRSGSVHGSMGGGSVFVVQLPF